MSDIVGSIAMLTSLVIIFIGFPAQIRRNCYLKSCKGIAPSLVYSSVLVYTVWAIYGWVKWDWFIILADTPGGILSFILVFQLFHYKDNDN